ncbi:MAG: sulfotransferase family 2 domain-containing protein [Planctomycetota bacterium]
MKRYDPSQPLIYTHIPKCAGSSVVRLLREWFDSEYYKLNQDERRDIVLPRVVPTDRKGRWLPNVKCIHGHFNHGRGYGLPYFYPEINQYFTILRDPFDLAVSMYFFAKGKSKAGKFWFRGESVDINDQFPNVESYVNSYPYWLFDHLPQDVTLDNYEERIRSKFIYIGVFEDLETSINNLAKLLGKPQTVLPRFNVSRYDENIPDHLREKFYADYPLLKKVYDLAVDTYQLEGYEFPADGSPPIPPCQSQVPLYDRLQREAG